MKKVLFLAYYYPPAGGAGVQRVAKFVKYLPEFNYEPMVVGGTDDDYFRGKQVDETLNCDVKFTTLFKVEDVGRERSVRRLSSNSLARCFQGSSMKRWIKSAKRISEEVIKREKPDVIYVTVSPYPVASMAAKLGQKYNIPWVLDMRDPWALDPISYYFTWLEYRLILMKMKHICHAATAVIMNTPRSLEAIKERFPELTSEKLYCITNGWDRNDLERYKNDYVSKSKTDVFTIVHTGLFHTQYAVKVDPNVRKTLSGKRKRITDYFRYSVGRSDLLARTPYYLFQSIRKLLDAGQITENDIRLIFVGAVTSEDKYLAKRYGLEDIIEFKGYLNHDESIRYLLSADLLFLPLHKPANGQFPLIVPGKTYEYLAARKPILGLLPPGDARDIVIDSGLGVVCEPTDVDQISRTLLDLMKRNNDHCLSIQPDERCIQQFERKELTQKLAGVFDTVISRN